MHIIFASSFYNTNTHTMKTIFISLMALATTVGSFANTSNPVSCPAGCPSINVKASSAGSAERFATKMARIENAYEDQKGYLHFQLTMAAALNRVATEKHLSAVEDLKSSSAYNQLMTGIFLEIEAGKLAEASENEQAIEQFNRLMEKTLISSAVL